jgi:hypothetical protein
MELADRHGVALANVSGDTDLSTPDGRFKARIMGAVARQESEKKGERMRREAEQAARRGVPRGSRRAFGYDVDRVTVRETEAGLIREAVQRMLDGASAASVARDWNGRGIPSPQAAAYGWSGSSVVGVLRNPRIMGARAYKGEILAEDAWPAIVDRATFERLQAKIRRGSRPGRSAKRLLSSIARCGRCGGPLWNSHRQDSGHRVTRYVCIKRPGAAGCGATTVVADKLDQLLTEAVLHRLQSPAMTRALRVKPNNKKNGVDVDLSRIERELEDLAADYGNGAISRREWLAARKPLEERRDRARRDIDHTNGTAALAQFRGTDVRARWEQLDVDRKRAVLDALVDRVTVLPSTTPGRFNPDRVEVEWRV